jgi:CRISPR-associated protein Cas1
MDTDLHALPKFRDQLSFIYVEHVRIDQHEKSIACHDIDGMVAIPVANLAVLMLGPGVSITHAAISRLAENNCLVIWCGEENVRFYAQGMGGTRSAARLVHQARLASDDALRMEIVRRMYLMRLGEEVDEATTLQQLRGMEGAHVRNAYQRIARETGVTWQGRSYDRQAWRSADPPNRALSAANSCLYGLCQAAILSAGYSPALGFIHTGKQQSFVYDIADLYKLEITVPLAFRLAAQGAPDLERSVRLACRDVFRDSQLMKRIVPDIARALGVEEELDEIFDEDPALPAELWEPKILGDDEEVSGDGSADR